MSSGEEQAPSDRTAHAVPPRVVATGRAAFTLHDPAYRVVHLVGDSLVDPWVSPPAPTDRRLLFARDGLTVDVVVSGSSEGLHLTVRPGPGTGAALGDDGLLDHITALQPGHLHSLRRVGAVARLDGLPPGLTTVVILASEARRSGVRTAWFTA